MADVDFDDVEGGYGDGYCLQKNQPAQRWVTAAGAVISVALLAGILVWGYRIAVRDVMGIPIVRAIEGPMRIAPDTPGGSVAAHQGLSVNDVAASGIVVGLPETVALAPRPVDLTDDDAAGLVAATPPLADVARAVSGPLLNQPDAALLADAPLPPDAVLPDGVSNVVALADEIAAGSVAFAPAPDPLADAALLDAAPVVEGGVGASPVPKARPARAQTPAQAAPQDDFAVMAALASVAAEVDPATLGAGTRLVQLGAFDSADQARAEWDKLSARFGELLGDKARVIQSAQSGGRTFFRLRAHGFETEDDSRRFCSALVAERAECIPVTLR